MMRDGYDLEKRNAEEDRGCCARSLLCNGNSRHAGICGDRTGIIRREDSEHLIDYTSEYQYCLNISYNEDGTPGLGSAIFLHCLGAQKPFTGGCVAIPQDKMITVMQNVRPDCVVVIGPVRDLIPELYEKWGLAAAEDAGKAQ